MRFRHRAEAAGAAVAADLGLPQHKRRFARADVGGRAGGDKFLVDGLFVKLARDSSGLYGGDAFAMKTAGLERLHVSLVMAASHPVLGVAPTVQLDVCGFRFLVSAQLALGDDTLVYGSADAGTTVHTDDAEVNAAALELGAALSLREHAVGPPSGRRDVCFGADVEVHRARDGAAYLLDAARLLPCESPRRTLTGFLLPGDGDADAGDASSRAVQAMAAMAAGSPDARTASLAALVSPVDVNRASAIAELERLLRGAIELHQVQGATLIARAGCVAAPPSSGASSAADGDGAGAAPSSSVAGLAAAPSVGSSGPNTVASLLLGRAVTGRAVLVSGEKGQHLAHVMRPEAVVSHPVALSADAFTGFGRADGLEHNRRGRVATRVLLERRVKDAAEDAVGGSVQLVRPSQVAAAARRRGVNVRHLGLVRSAAAEKAPGSSRRTLEASRRGRSLRAHSFALFDMVARTAKGALREAMRRAAGAEDAASPEHGMGRAAEAARSAANAMLGSGPGSASWWRLRLPLLLRIKFGAHGQPLAPVEMHARYDLRRQLPFLGMAGAIAAASGLRVRPGWIVKVSDCLAAIQARKTGLGATGAASVFDGPVVFDHRSLGNPTDGTTAIRPSTVDAAWRAAEAAAGPDGGAAEALVSGTVPGVPDAVVFAARFGLQYSLSSWSDGSGQARLVGSSRLAGAAWGPTALDDGVLDSTADTSAGVTMMGGPGERWSWADAGPEPLGPEDVEGIDAAATTLLPDAAVLAAVQRACAGAADAAAASAEGRVRVGFDPALSSGGAVVSEDGRRLAAFRPWGASAVADGCVMGACTVPSSMDAEDAAGSGAAAAGMAWDDGDDGGGDAADEHAGAGAGVSADEHTPGELSVTFRCFGDASGVFLGLVSQPLALPKTGRMPSGLLGVELRNGKDAHLLSPAAHYSRQLNAESLFGPVDVTVRCSSAARSVEVSVQGGPGDDGAVPAAGGETVEGTPTSGLHPAVLFTGSGLCAVEIVAMRGWHSEGVVDFDERVAPPEGAARASLTLVTSAAGATGPSGWDPSLARAEILRQLAPGGAVRGCPAVEEAELLVGMTEEVFGTDSDEHTDARVELAEALVLAGRAAEARVVAEAAMGSRGALSGDGSVEVACSAAVSSLRVFGDAAMEDGRFAAAEHCYRRALAALTLLGGGLSPAPHPHCIVLLDRLCSSLGAQNRHYHAVSLASAACTLWQRMGLEAPLVGGGGSEALVLAFGRASLDFLSVASDTVHDCRGLERRGDGGLVLLSRDAAVGSMASLRAWAEVLRSPRGVSLRLKLPLGSILDGEGERRAEAMRLLRERRELPSLDGSGRPGELFGWGMKGFEQRLTCRDGEEAAAAGGHGRPDLARLGYGGLYPVFRLRGRAARDALDNARSAGSGQSDAGLGGAGSVGSRTLPRNDELPPSTAGPRSVASGSSWAGSAAGSTAAGAAAPGPPDLLRATSSAGSAAADEGETVVDISASDAAVFAVTSEGRVLVWPIGRSSDTSKQSLALGDTGTLRRGAMASEVTGLAGRRVTGSASGHAHTLFLSVDGGVSSSGEGSHGALGLGDTVSHGPPRLIPQLQRVAVSRVFAGEGTSFAVAAGGALFAWGDNRQGQLGLGHTAETLTPERVPLAAPTAKVASLTNSTVVLTADGVLLRAGCWGFSGMSGTSVQSVFTFAALPSLRAAPGINTPAPRFPPSPELRAAGEFVRGAPGERGGAPAVSDEASWSARLADPYAGSGLVFDLATRFVDVAANALGVAAVTADGRLFTAGSREAKAGGCVPTHPPAWLAEVPLPHAVRRCGPLAAVFGGVAGRTFFAVSRQGTLFGWGGGDVGARQIETEVASAARSRPSGAPDGRFSGERTRPVVVEPFRHSAVAKLVSSGSSSGVTVAMTGRPDAGLPDGVEWSRAVREQAEGREAAPWARLVARVEATGETADSAHRGDAGPIRVLPGQALEVVWSGPHDASSNRLCLVTGAGEVIREASLPAGSPAGRATLVAPMSLGPIWIALVMGRSPPPASFSSDDVAALPLRVAVPVSVVSGPSGGFAVLEAPLVENNVSEAGGTVRPSGLSLRLRLPLCTTAATLAAAVAGVVVARLGCRAVGSGAGALDPAPGSVVVRRPFGRGQCAASGEVTRLRDTELTAVEGGDEAQRAAVRAVWGSKARLPHDWDPFAGEPAPLSGGEARAAMRELLSRPPPGPGLPGLTLRIDCSPRGPAHGASRVALLGSSTLAPGRARNVVLALSGSASWSFSSWGRMITPAHTGAGRFSATGGVGRALTVAGVSAAFAIRLDAGAEIATLGLPMSDCESLPAVTAAGPAPAPCPVEAGHPGALAPGSVLAAGTTSAIAAALGAGAALPPVVALWMTDDGGSVVAAAGGRAAQDAWGPGLGGAPVEGSDEHAAAMQAVAEKAWRAACKPPARGAGRALLGRVRLPEGAQPLRLVVAVRSPAGAEPKAEPGHGLGGAAAASASSARGATAAGTGSLVVVWTSAVVTVRAAVAASPRASLAARPPQPPGSAPPPGGGASMTPPADPAAARAAAMATSGPEHEEALSEVILAYRAMYEGKGLADDIIGPILAQVEDSLSKQPVMALRACVASVRAMS